MRRENCLVLCDSRRLRTGNGNSKTQFTSNYRIAFLGQVRVMVSGDYCVEQDLVTKHSFVPLFCLDWFLQYLSSSLSLSFRCSWLIPLPTVACELSLGYQSTAQTYSPSHNNEWIRDGHQPKLGQLEPKTILGFFESSRCGSLPTGSEGQKQRAAAAIVPPQGESTWEEEESSE